MKILIFDNYDSFTYNILNALDQLGYTDIDVIRNDKIALEDIDIYDKIILSPGPGIPEEAGLLLDLIKRYGKTKSIFGICLGHQAIGEAFGAKLENLTNLYHAKTSEIFFEAKDHIFDSFETGFTAGRYHSWIVSRDGFPDELEITASDKDGQIMALKHKEYDIHAVQFHPESILTPNGEQILKSFLEGQ
ncbi:MAG: aminodeoxychorismate/anthranilate synthase component II [Opitutales bacterium]